MPEVADLTEKARNLLSARRYGALATNSRKMPGYPYGSVVNFAVDQEWRPLLLLSSLAVHTQNLLVDSRASLLVTAAESEQNQLAAARLTIIGELGLIPIADEAAGREAYAALHPESNEYAGFGDFALYRMAISTVYYVDGFGEMGWIPKLT